MTAFGVPDADSVSQEELAVETRLWTQFWLTQSCVFSFQRALPGDPVCLGLSWFQSWDCPRRQQTRTVGHSSFSRVTSRGGGESWGTVPLGGQTGVPR